jgi:uncharacterized sodium:solute symporter family permease YidK
MSVVQSLRNRSNAVLLMVAVGLLGVVPAFATDPVGDAITASIGDLSTTLTSLIAPILALVALGTAINFGVRWLKKAGHLS